MENIYLPKELFTESEQKIDGNTIKRCLSEQIGAYETDMPLGKIQSLVCQVMVLSDRVDKLERLVEGRQ